MKAPPVKKMACELGCILISAVFLVPFAMMLLGSFKTSAEAARFDLRLPTTWVVDNYVQVFRKADIATAFLNSCFYSFVATGIICLLAAMAAFVLVRGRTRRMAWTYNAFIVGMILPPNLVTTVFVLKGFGLYGSRAGLIGVYVAWAMPLLVFLYSGFIKSLHREIDEAAIVDGCNLTKLFLKVVFPMLKPVTITAIVISVLGVWNDFIAQLYFVGDSDLWSMPMTIYKFFGMYSRDWNLVFADLVLTTLPVAILYLFLQKHIVAGMSVGAVKG